MKLSIYSVLILISYCAIGQEVEPEPAVAVPLSWHTEEDPAKADAKSKDKPVLIYFSADWCDFCHTMDKETLKKPRVSRYLNENFILLKVDYDGNKDLVARYRVRGVPTMIIGDPQLQKTEQTSGFMPEDVFLAWAEMSIPIVSSEAIEAEKEEARDYAEELSLRFRQGLTEDQYAAINEFYESFANKEPEAVEFAKNHLTDEIKHNPGRFSRFLKNEKLQVRILTANAFAKLYGNFEYDPWDLNKENYAQLESFLEENNISSLLEDLINF